MLLLAASLLCSPVLATAEHPLAPDGRRGFGAAATTDEVRVVVLARDGEDAEFLAGLRELEPGVRAILEMLSEDARARGLDALLAPERRRDLDLAELHAALRTALAAPEPVLDAGDDRARALAEMLLDERLRARVWVLEEFEDVARELRRGLAVLVATAEGYVVLGDRERGLIGVRVDLAASRLRALTNDLAVLRPPDLDREGRRARADAAAELLAATPEERASRLGAAGGQAERMTSMLFTARLLAREDVARLLEQREAARHEAGRFRQAALEYLPDTPEGEAAPPQITELQKHERLRLAGLSGRAGMAHDPLDEVCVFAAAHAENYAWGSERARHLFDHYLALRGIRPSDHRTLRGRELTAWESEALAVVSVLGGGR